MKRTSPATSSHMTATQYSLSQEQWRYQNQRNDLCSCSCSCARVAAATIPVPTERSTSRVRDYVVTTERASTIRRCSERSAFEVTARGHRSVGSRHCSLDTNIATLRDLRFVLERETTRPFCLLRRASESKVCVYWCTSCRTSYWWSGCDWSRHRWCCR